MSNLQNESFKKFLKSFNEGEYKNHKYYDTITEISRKGSGNREPLIINKKEMYSLDDIAKGSKSLKGNLPKTTDALCYKEDDNGKLSLYLIEFKFHNLDKPDPKDQLSAFVDNIFAERKKAAILARANLTNKDYKSIDYNSSSRYFSDAVTMSLHIESNRIMNGKETNTEKELVGRVEKISRDIQDLTASETYRIIDKKHITLIRPPIKKTNVILKNTHFQYAMKLWNYLQDNIDDKTIPLRINFGPPAEFPFSRNSPL